MPKKNPRKPAGAPDHHRCRPTFQQATPPTPPALLLHEVSGCSLGRAEPGPSYFDQPLGGATLEFAAAADDVDDDNFMSAGVVDPNDVLPSPGPHFCNLSLREGESSTSRLTTRPTFTRQDLAIVDQAAGKAADPLSYGDRFPGPSSYESTYELGYSRTDVYCPSSSYVTASEALGYPSDSASGCQAEGAAVQLSTSGTYSSAVSDEISELPGTSESLDPYGDSTGGGSAGGGYQKSHVQSTSEESDAPSPSASASKKGSYTHRHCRLYGLSEEEKMQRSKTLNNEATQLYRERKRKRQKEVEGDLTKEEEKKRELLQQKRELQKEIEKYRKALGKGDDRDPPGDGNLYM